MIKNTLIIILILMLNACTPKTFELNPKFKSQIQTKKKINVSVIRPDTHVLEIGFNETTEDQNASDKASKVFMTNFQKYFGEYFSVKKIVDEKCLIAEDTNNTRETKKCSELLKMFRQTTVNKNTGEKNRYKINKLSNKYDATVYLYAVEPTRSAGEMTKDMVVSTTLMVLTGVAPVKSYVDLIRFVVVDNHTGEILWTDSISGGSLDIDDEKEMEEKFSTLKTNFIKAFSSKE